MNRYPIITNIVLSNIEEKCFGLKKLEGYQHLISVATTMMIMAPIRKLNSELASCIGILHDYSTYYTNTSFDHANRSSLLAREMLEKSTMFNPEEIHLMTTAIYYHSQKDNIHDDYSELLKDVDIYQQYLIEPNRAFTAIELQRIESIKKHISA